MSEAGALPNDPSAPSAPVTAGKPRRPATKQGRFAMWLGFATAGVGVFMWLLTMVSYWISMGLNTTVPFVMPVLLMLVVVDVICAVAAAVTGFRARRLDPSSAGTLALVLGCLAGAFWALAVILEIAGAVFGWE